MINIYTCLFNGEILWQQTFMLGDVLMFHKKNKTLMNGNERNVVSGILIVALLTNGNKFRLHVPCMDVFLFFFRYSKSTVVVQWNIAFKK